ncbi:MAG: transposase [Dokdonella sp.]|nr:transposase [Dokdonella sp.]
MPRLAAFSRQAEVRTPRPTAHAAPRYARHAPERTLLYAPVHAHYPDFIARLEAEDRTLPDYVREEFDDYLRCGVLDHGFLRVVCEHCHAERLVAFSCKKRGFCPSCGARCMAESARHLVEDVFGPRPVRQWVLSLPYPLRFLFASKPEAIGPVQGVVQRVIGAWLADEAGVPRRTAQCGAVTLIQRFGSALNLNVHFHMLWLDGVYEKLCRYITRPAISEKRLSISAQGRVRYELKTPWRNGTTHVEWDPVDFIAKLAALVPPPRAHLTRFHGVFAPNAALRAQLTPSGRGKRPATDAAPVEVSANEEPRGPEEQRRAMTWAQRLKRVFSIDVTPCVHCGGAVRIVASIEEPAVVRAILAHFEKHGAREAAHYRPAARAPSAAAA